MHAVQNYYRDVPTALSEYSPSKSELTKLHVTDSVTTLTFTHFYFICSSIAELTIEDYVVLGSEPTSPVSSIKPLISSETDCDRAVRVYFNADDSITCIGNT